ncbi:hypothetical protein U1Q18_023088 [Sarracenia purpurea var. burkii]
MIKRGLDKVGSVRVGSCLPLLPSCTKNALFETLNKDERGKTCGTSCGAYAGLAATQGGHKQRSATTGDERKGGEAWWNWVRRVGLVREGAAD